MKYFLSCPYYDKSAEKWHLYSSHIKPRNKLYCNIHNFQYIEANYDNFSLPKEIFPTMPSERLPYFARWYVLKKGIEQGIFKDGDTINYHDSDVFIVQLNKTFITNKSYTYAIDSGNTHCTGIWSIKINDFSKRLIEGILSQERYEMLKNYPVVTEYDDSQTTFYINDQHAYYWLAGIKPHSWKSFFELPNNGFHSFKTEHTLFTLDELHNNIELLGPEWNTTHLPEETGDNGKPCWFDIVRTTKDKVINRHFAGGQKWLVEEYLEYSKRYK
jgi:hypothetical protein